MSLSFSLILYISSTQITSINTTSKKIQTKLQITWIKICWIGVQFSCQWFSLYCSRQDCCFSCLATGIAWSLAVFRPVELQSWCIRCSTSASSAFFYSLLRSISTLARKMILVILSCCMLNFLNSNFYAFAFIWMKKIAWYYNRLAWGDLYIIFENLITVEINNKLHFGHFILKNARKSVLGYNFGKTKASTFYFK